MTKKFVWSNFQQDIFKNIANGSGNLVVEAYAGASKTSTILECFRYVPKGKSILAVAFNKRIADELKERAPSYSNLDICTLHSLGLRAIKTHFKDIKVYPDKTEKIIEALLFKQGEKKDFDAIFNLQRAVSLCKSFVIDAPSQIDDLLDQFGIDAVNYSRDEFIKLIIDTLSKCKLDKFNVDYDDMIYFPCLFNLSVGKWDYVFIDEAQDLNQAQIHIALSACKKDGRIIICGDRNQVLYSFRGADINIIDNLTTKLKASKLELPISYRCGKRIIYEAQKLVPAIKHASNAIDGEIINIGSEDLMRYIKPGDFLLSRINAPLIQWCLTFLKHKIPANIIGKDVSAQLKWLIHHSKKKSIDTFVPWLKKWRDSEVKRLQEKNRSTWLIQDKVDCLLRLCKDASSIDDVKKKLNEIFTDNDNERITLSSIHGAKGLETNNVFILTKALDLYGTEQEIRNIRYVAITRAKKKLYYVNKS